MQNSPQDVHKKVLGKKGEKLVEDYLIKHGCKILSRNFRTPFGEADIIAQDGEEIAYKLGDEITEPGEYKVTVTDEIGNTAEYNFTIKAGLNGGIIALIVIVSILAVGGVVVFILKKKEII